MTALATTAVLATGWPMTPTLPTRAGLRGMSVSFGRGASSASIEAMIAWIGIRPSAMSWPPERRAADANGAAHRFSQMSTPAVLPGSMAAARCTTSSSASSSASSASSCLQRAEVVDVGELHRVDRAVLVLGQDQHVDHADGSGVDEREQLVGHLAGEVARSRRELDDDVVDGAEFIQGCVGHVHTDPGAAWAPAASHGSGESGVRDVIPFGRRDVHRGLIDAGDLPAPANREERPMATSNEAAVAPRRAAGPRPPAPGSSPTTRRTRTPRSRRSSSCGRRRARRTSWSSSSTTPASARRARSAGRARRRTRSASRPAG